MRCIAGKDTGELRMVDNVDSRPVVAKKTEIGCLPLDGTGPLKLQDNL